MSREEGRALPVTLDRLERLALRAFRVTGKPEGVVSLVTCDDAFIRVLNGRYLGEDEPTDVLSFPMREGEGGGPMLGDIVISVDTAERQAGERGETPEREFALLYVHGLLHLLGYTHDFEADGASMAAAAAAILPGDEREP